MTGSPVADGLQPPTAPGAAIVRAIRWLVPADRREDWEAEWMGEIEYAWARRLREGGGPLDRLALVVRCLGAIPDAFCIRRRHGGDDVLGQDLRYALRSLWRRPGFSTIVVLTLALGIGANTAIFTIVNAVLLRPLPYREPSQLVMVWGSPTDGDSAKVGRGSSFPDYLDIRDQSTAFSALAATGREQTTLTGPGIEPTVVAGAGATANLFPLLGVSPALGRGFVADDDRKGAAPVTILSHELWQRLFNAESRVIGSTVSLNGDAYTVIGVMPRDFAFSGRPQLWFPLAPLPGAVERGVHSFNIVGRLGPGVTLQKAEAEVRAIARRLEQQYPDMNAKRSARVESMQEAMVGDVRTSLFVLLGAVGLVLLIGCTNVANLFLARAAAREREVAVRSALGAGRMRLARQFLTESLLLALLGGAAGLLLAHWGSQALIAAAPQSIPRASEVGIDLTVLVFLLAVSLITGVAFGVIPAMQFARRESVTALREGARGSTAGGARRRFRQGLVISEVALAVVLVAGAALLIKSFWRLQQVDPGFDPRNLVVVPIQLPPARYPEHPRVRAIYDGLRETIAARPDVQSVAIGYQHPLAEGWTSSFLIEGREPPPSGEEPEARVRPVTPGYFRTVGVRLLSGRDLASTDVVGAPGAVVINEAFAKLHFPNEDPLGRRITRRAWWPGMPDSYTIVGVVADERFRGLQVGADPATYYAFAQFTFNDNYLIVRTRGDAAAVVTAIREAVRAIDRDLPLDGIRAMDEFLAESVASPRFSTSLLALFAAVALVLSAIGIYGVLSYTVTQRTNEIGIRMALGAGGGSVLRLVVGQGMRLALIGVAAGTAGALVLSRVLSSLLYDTSATDPLVFATVALLLTAVAFAAAYIPARRASRVDPMVALRAE